MPYSERFGLVHVAIPKTGTTSVVNALHRLHKLHGGALTLIKEKVDAPFRKRHRLDEIGDPRPGRAKHLSAIQLKYILGEAYERSFSFTFVRNPWARTVSRYFFTRIENRPPLWERLRRGTTRTFHKKDFNEWLRGRAAAAEKDGGLRNQIDKLSDLEGRLIVNSVGRLEDVQNGFARVCERAGVEPIEVPHVNGTGQGRRYASFYDDWSRDLVLDLYRRDIEAFGYEFGA